MNGEAYIPLEGDDPLSASPHGAGTVATAQGAHGKVANAATSHQPLPGLPRGELIAIDELSSGLRRLYFEYAPLPGMRRGELVTVDEITTGLSRLYFDGAPRSGLPHGELVAVEELASGLSQLHVDNPGRRERSTRDHHASRREREDRRERERERGGDRGDRGDRERDRERDRGDRRRRSRSPFRRREDTDTYSSSRDYREREREDRYRRDDRRDDRWERGDRRRERRDEEERPRRDRDLFDDRRGGGGGASRRDRGDRGDRERERERNSSPPRAKKEPTPDLTDATSARARQRRLVHWDIKPPNYDNVSAEQAKLSGMFPLPGAPRQPAMDMSRLQALRDSAGSASHKALMPVNSRQSRRVLVCNLPSGSTPETIKAFFNAQMNSLNVVKNEDPCASVKMNKERTLALLEFKTPEEATVALAYDGLPTNDPGDAEMANGYANGGARALEVRRPRNYIIAYGRPEEGRINGVNPDDVPDSPNKILISNLPSTVTEDEAREILSAFGALKHFVMARDKETGDGRGFAFCEFENPDITDGVCQGLNGMPIGDMTLKVSRALVGVTQSATGQTGVHELSMLAGAKTDVVVKSRVIQLLNMVTAKELLDSQDHQEIMEEVKEECSKYGQILELKIPRPTGARQNMGVGKIFIKYESIEVAEKAAQALAGRIFNNRTVIVMFFDEDLFDVDGW